MKDYTEMPYYDDYKLDKKTYQSLLVALSYLNDGRIFLAKEVLEEILSINPDKGGPKYA